MLILRGTELFKQEFPNLVDEALKTKDPQDNRPVLVMAQDEGRFGRLVRVMKAWCPSGHRPLVAKQGVMATMSKLLCFS